MTSNGRRHNSRSVHLEPVDRTTQLYRRCAPTATIPTPALRTWGGNRHAMRNANRALTILLVGGLSLVGSAATRGQLLAAEVSPGVSLATAEWLADEGGILPGFSLASDTAAGRPGHASRDVGSLLLAHLDGLKHGVCSDYANFYSRSTMGDLLLGIAGTSILANTPLDADFQQWYQDDVRSAATDDFGAFFKNFGEGDVVIPIASCIAFGATLLDGPPALDLAGEFGRRTTRSFLVGSPPVLFAQYAVGSSRPGESSAGSKWKPFDDCNGVSGHAFVGALPFITAARMAEGPWLKGLFYACSTFTAWSRVDHDVHYLSQAGLGWWMAYLACRAVDETQQQDRGYALRPIVTPEMAGVGIVLWR